MRSNTIWTGRLLRDWHDGEVRGVPGGFEIRFQRVLRHPIERVWRALTNSDELGKWLAPGEIDLRLGGCVSLAFTNSPAVIESTVTALDQPRLLEYHWVSQDGDGGPVRWELAPHEGGTLLVLTCTVPAELEKWKFKSLAGWHSIVEMLVGLLHGKPVLWSMERWQEIHNHYVSNQ